MFAKSPIDTKLDEEITSLLAKLAETQDKTSEEYATLAKRLSELHKLKSEDRPKRISPDTALAVAANIFGILWVARYEKENVIPRSAFGLIKKP